MKGLFYCFVKCARIDFLLFVVSINPFEIQNNVICLLWFYVSLYDRSRIVGNAVFSNLDNN